MGGGGRLCGRAEESNPGGQCSEGRGLPLQHGEFLFLFSVFFFFSYSQGKGNKNLEPPTLES